MKKRVLIFVQAVFFYLLFILVGYTITGRIERKHPVLPENTRVSVSGRSLDITQLAKEYQPIILSDKDTPKPIDLKYEVSESNDEYIIVYHAEWEDEKHPNVIQDFAWRIFRFAYFGFTTKDSEYIQININKQSGKLAKAVFDSPVENGFSLWAHDLRITQNLEYLNENIYSLTQLESDQSETVRLLENKLILEVGNWNHLFNIAEENNLKNAINFKVEYLTDEDYKWYKYARRHHGEVFTPKSPANTPIIFFASIIFITYLVIILRDYAFSDKKEEEEKTKNA